MRYRLDSLILSTGLFKSLKFFLYFIPWHYFPIKKYSNGQRVRLALEELGPIFIKFGQTLSTRADLLPADVINELTKLQDKCPSFDSNEAKKIIEKSLNNNIPALFEKFDDSPLASASISQVHTAITKNGDDVVVKVLRPNILKIIQRDISFMYAIARIVNKKPIGKKIRPIEIVAEFERIILKELNLLNEASNAILLRKNFSDSNLLYVPKVYMELCGKNVLTTERIYGTPINNIKKLKADNVDLKKLAEDGVIIFFTQVFKHNFFHADMHPGNIFVGKDDNYIGVDFGIMGTLNEQDKDFLASIFLGFFTQDYKKIAQTYVDSGWIGSNADIEDFESAIRHICSSMFEKPLDEVSFGQILLSLIQEAKKFDVVVQPQLLLLDKTLINVEGLGRQLYPKLDLWSTARPFLEKLAKEKHSAKNIFAELKKQNSALLKELPELPMMTINALKQINNLKNLNDLQNQKLQAINDKLEDNYRKQKYAIFAGAMLIVSGILLAINLLEYSVISFILSLFFWLKSR